MKEIKNKSLKLHLMVAAVIIIIAVSGMLSARFTNSTMMIGTFILPFSGLVGCLQGVVFCLGILMVIVDYKYGSRYAILCIAFSMLGSIRQCIVSGSLAALPGTISGLIQILSIFIIRTQFDRIVKFGRTDHVTGIINRYGFERILQSKIAKSERIYLVLFHIDGINQVNINIGRSYGDELLKIIANRIKEVIGEEGWAFKLEGTEYAIILPEDYDITKVVQAVIEKLQDRIILNKNGIDYDCYISAKAGIADCVNALISPDQLIKNADSAMNYAINSGNMSICVYNEKIKGIVDRQIELERYIKEGFEKDWFYLVYQPQYYISDKKLRGFETLIRMRMPDGTIISPAEFIPAAEKSDLILEIDEYVIRRALHEFARTLRNASEKIILSINVSAKDIAALGFAEKVCDIVDDMNFPPESLEIEITEYSFADSLEETINNITKLRNKGIMIALDDFGTGYTSLSQLLTLPINLLKIDKSLIDNMEESETNRDFVKAVIYMGHLMNCEVISEGVEEDSQLKLLNELDCDFVQGFVWGKPMEYEDAKYELPIVDFGGISHIIIERDININPEKTIVDWCEELNLESLGLIFVNEENGKIYMNPLVYVPELRSCYWESSCGSGTTALGTYLYYKNGSNVDLDINEPGGVMNIKVDENGPVLTGSVIFEKEVTYYDWK